MANLDKLIEKAKEHFEPNENVIAAVLGAYETKIMGQDSQRNGILIASNKRLLFYAKKLTGFDLEVFPYSTISSIEMSKRLMGHKITIYASGNKATVKWIQKGDVQKFMEEAKARIGKKEVKEIIPESPLLQDIPEQIRKLAELRDQGILSETEFEIKKKELLAKM